MIECQSDWEAASESAESYHLIPFMERDADLTALLEDDRIHSVSETILGPDFFLIDTHIRRGDTPWHGRGRSQDPDHESTYLPGVRVAIYFDRLRRDNGCLRAIPGSHLRPMADLF